jgi:hypothetical protein
MLPLLLRHLLAVLLLLLRQHRRMLLLFLAVLLLLLLLHRRMLRLVVCSFRAQPQRLPRTKERALRVEQAFSCVGEVRLQTCARHTSRLRTHT